MLLFRSEEHLERWIRGGARPRGETMSLDQQWCLAREWFRGRHLPAWRKRSAAQAEEILRSAGLGGDFWRLA